MHGRPVVASLVGLLTALSAAVAIAQLPSTGTGEIETHSLPELVTRYEVTDRVELYSGWNYELGGASNSFSGNVPDLDEPTGAELERGSQFLYGLKAAVTDQNDWLPECAVIVETGTPTSGKETVAQLVTTYVFGCPLTIYWLYDTL